MKGRIVQMGDSRGIRLPNSVLEQVSLPEEVEIEVQANQIVIRAAHSPREGWEDAFRRMAERGDDEVSDEQVSLTEFDEVDWRW